MFDVFGDYVVPFLFALTILVFVHELGHYLIAKRNGVKVEVFSIGFGPELFGWNDKSETRWKICAIPFGGYVKMFGDSDASSSGLEEGERPFTDEEKAVSFHYKSLGARTAIVAAGPIANFIFAAVVFAALFMFSGVPQWQAAIGTVQEGSAAENAGLQKGDLIVSMNGQKLNLFDDLREIVGNNPGVGIKTVILRKDQSIDLVITPTLKEIDGTAKGFLGVSPDAEQVEYIRYNPATAVWMGVEKTYSLSAQILGHLGELIRGERSADELGGPLRIAQVSGEVAKGGLISLISFMAVLSVNLGLINLFPIPMLDGGHLVFYAAEAVRGKPLSERAQEYGFRFGLTLVLGLMVFATWNDLVQMKVFDFFIQLFT